MTCHALHLRAETANLASQTPPQTVHTSMVHYVTQQYIREHILQYYTKQYHTLCKNTMINTIQCNE